MKRLTPKVALVAAVAIAGGLVTGCNASQPAATVNGSSVSVSTVNDQMTALTQTEAGLCLLSIESQGQLPQAIGTGGQGSDGSVSSYDIAFADSVVRNSVDVLVYQQLAATKHLEPSDSDLANVKSELTQSFDQQIGSNVQQAQQSGSASYCATKSGQALTGTQLLAELPSYLSAQQVDLAAANEALLTQGADVSEAAIAAYYAANTNLFTNACLSVIATNTTAQAQAALAKLAAGQSFASVAASDSVDPQSAANGGSIGCTNTLAAVQQDLGLSSVTVGKPVGPLSSGSGLIYIYEITQLNTVPLAQAAPTARAALLTSSTNESRVETELQVFARASSISVDPRYGTWSGDSVVPPLAPPTRDLQPYGLPSSPDTSSSPDLSGLSGLSGSSGSAGVGG